VNLARKIAHAAFLSRRLVGVLLDRKGEVREVMVGDATRLYLPEIGRRGGKDRLRGLRLVAARPTPLSMENKKLTLAHDFRTDLEKLRLDAVIEIDASHEQDGPVVLGHLFTDRSGEQNLVTSKIINFRSVHELSENFSDFIKVILDDLELTDKSFNQKDRAILVGVYSTSKKQGLSSMAELSELARSAHVSVADKIYQWRAKSYPKTLIGIGKLEEICLHALSLGVEMLIFDGDLSPSQLMNITDMTDLKILDRSMLILDIFAQRAVTREGKMQVEMAQLIYSLPRLEKKQSGLSRLTGGIGGRGPGETKLEVNKRRVKDRLAKLEAEMGKIKKQRELRRKVRKDNQLPTLAIVGYTNAGKSTLINALSGSDIYAKDELFATLDPHSRRLRFPRDQEVVVTDTVGFINNLPESLMKAFMATLEELDDADLLLHVVDIADDNYELQIKVVNDVLKELEIIDKPKVLVLNKVDKLSRTELLKRKKGLNAICISAFNKEGLDKLIKAASAKLWQINSQKSSKLDIHEGEVIFDERK
jgi:GTP-binding protein HflX